MPLSSLMIEHGPWLQSRGCRTQRGAQLTAAGRTLIESRAAEPLLPCTAWGRVPRHFPLRPASPPQPRRGHEQTPLTAAARQPSLFLLAHSLSTHRRRDLGGSSPLHAALARRLPVAHRGSPDGTQRPPLTPPSSAREAPRGGPAPPRRVPAAPRRGDTCPRPARSPTPRPAEGRPPAAGGASRVCVAAFRRAAGLAPRGRAAAAAGRLPPGRRGAGPPARHRAAPHAAGACGDPPSARGLGGPSRRPPHAALLPVRPRVGSGPRPLAAHGFPALPGARRGRPLRRRLPK